MIRIRIVSQSSRVELSVGGEETVGSGDQGDSHWRIGGRTVRSEDLRQIFQTEIPPLQLLFIFIRTKKNESEGKKMSR